MKGTIACPLDTMPPNEWSLSATYRERLAPLLLTLSPPSGAASLRRLLAAGVGSAVPRASSSLHPGRCAIRPTLHPYCSAIDQADPAPLLRRHRRAGECAAKEAPPAKVPHIPLSNAVLRRSPAPCFANLRMGPSRELMGLGSVTGRASHCYRPAGGLAGKRKQTEIGRLHHKTFPNFRSGAKNLVGSRGLLTWPEGAPDLTHQSLGFTRHFPAGRQPAARHHLGSSAWRGTRSWPVPGAAGPPRTCIGGGGGHKGRRGSSDEGQALAPQT